MTDAEVVELLTCQRDSLDRINSEQDSLVQELSQLQTEVEERRACNLAAGTCLALPQLAQLFHLTPFEEQCVLICLAPELDRKYEKLYAYIQDDATRKKPSIDLVLTLLCDSPQEKLSARAAFGTHAPLLQHRLLQIGEAGSEGSIPFLSRTLKLDDRIVNFLLGLRQMDARLESCARLMAPQVDAEQMVVWQEVYERTSRFVQEYFQGQSANRNAIFYIHGSARWDKQFVAAAVCRDLNLPLLIGDVEKLKTGPGGFEEMVWLLGREAMLLPAVLCLENIDCLVGEADKHQPELKSLLKSLRAFSRLTFLLGTAAWHPQNISDDHLLVDVAFPGPELAMSKRLWESRLATCKLAEDVDSEALSGKFRVGPTQIKDAVAAAENMARWRSPQDPRVTMADLTNACRAQSSPKLGALARKIDPKYTWSEIVLPPDNLAQLKDLCQQARYRQLVYGEWGFDRKLSLGKGLNALFSGPPGTGKTMSAEVIANELQLDLYRIDLSQVVSKYIGETEKNLHQIFLEAETGHAILFFDEADALFGKRSEVKDAHDRYANIEVGYLLQKMEEYEGVAILATNLSQHMDEAFLRRMHFIVEFPFPDQEYRRQIWQVVFPREAPLADEVDFDVLAREIKLPGGNIKNIALAAAFYAAGNGRVIRMPHLWQAARREHQKLGRTWKEAEFLFK